MKNGSLYAGINSRDLVYSSKAGKYVVNSRNTNSDHAISIIGWDDNFSKENFPSYCQPKNNGAYIAVNSWKNSWGSDSIFYISYEDYNVEEEMRFYANILRWNEKTEQLTSGRSDMVKIEKDDTSIRGSGFSADGVSKQFSFSGNVTGNIETSEDSGESFESEQTEQIEKIEQNEQNEQVMENAL